MLPLLFQDSSLFKGSRHPFIHPEANSQVLVLITHSPLGELSYFTLSSEHCSLVTFSGPVNDYVTHFRD